MTDHTTTGETTTYASWCPDISRYTLLPEDDITIQTQNGAADWIERLESTGAYKAMFATYRAEINRALPPGVSLSRDQFHGPADATIDQWDGYPTNPDLTRSHGLDINAIVQDIDLESIVETHDPDLGWSGTEDTR